MWSFAQNFTIFIINNFISYNNCFVHHIVFSIINLPILINVGNFSLFTSANSVIRFPWHMLCFWMWEKTAYRSRGFSILFGMPLHDYVSQLICWLSNLIAMSKEWLISTIETELKSIIVSNKISLFEYSCCTYPVDNPMLVVLSSKSLMLLTGSFKYRDISDRRFQFQNTRFFDS